MARKRLTKEEIAATRQREMLAMVNSLCAFAITEGKGMAALRAFAFQCHCALDGGPTLAKVRVIPADPFLAEKETGTDARIIAGMQRSFCWFFRQVRDSDAIRRKQERSKTVSNSK